MVTTPAPGGAPPEHPTDAFLRAMKPFHIAFREKNFEVAAESIRDNLESLSPLVRRHRKNPRAFSLEHMVLPVIKWGGLALALANDEHGLARMRRIVESEPELQRWLPHIDRHDLSRRLIRKIEDRIRTRTPCLQSELKGMVGTTDGRLVAQLVMYLETAGRLGKVRSGSTWRLLPPKPRPRVASHRTPRTAPLRPVELSSLPRIPLPRALAKWELVEKDRLPDDCPIPRTSFEVRDADWRSPSVERMPPALRPDPAIRRFFPSRSGVVMTTDRRLWPHFGGNDASALHYDLDGRISVRTTLPHGLLRAYLPPLGSALIGVSLDGVVHAHDETMTPIFETALPDAPEIEGWRDSLPEESNDRMIHAPPIAISPDADRYLFALDDRVHCVDRNGDALWGRQFPDPRWLHAADYYGVGHEQPDLGPRPPPLPRRPVVNPKIFRWRLPDDWPADGDLGKLDAMRAKWWLTEHLGMPDDIASEYMKLPASAPEDLAGVEPDTSPPENESWRPRFVRELSRREVETPYGTCEVREVDGIDSPPMTRVQEVAFSSTCGTAFVATSDGSVWALDEFGDAIRVYVGIGGPRGFWPDCVTGRRTRRIVHIGNCLYLMTEAQLFVLVDDDLQAILDVLPREELYNTPNGFGLLTERRIRWYHRDGTYLGTVLSRRPIHRLYRAAADTVIETRTERAVFSDVPVW